MAYQDYINCSREALLEKMAELLPEKRLTHCLGVERAAIELAKRFGVDAEKAGLAGLLHDYAKKLSDQEFLDLIDRYQLNPDLKNWGNNVWHGMVGIYKIQEDLDLHDSEILRAIEIHTVGAGQMTNLDKVIYVADYIEHNRAFQEWMWRVRLQVHRSIRQWPMKQHELWSIWLIRDSPSIPKPLKPITPLCTI